MRMRNIMENEYPKSLKASENFAFIKLVRLCRLVDDTDDITILFPTMDMTVVIEDTVAQANCNCTEAAIQS